MTNGHEKSPIQEHRPLAIGALVLAAILFLAVILLSETAFRGVRLDLTEQKIFTVSDGTRQTLAEVEEPITIRLFATRLLLDGTPGLGDYAARVQELLERYVALSGGNLRLELVDAVPFSPAEDRATGYGLNGIPLTEAGDLGYFGIAASNSTDDVDVIPFLSPQRERFLEYDLTRMIHNLGNPRKKVIALVTGIPVDSDPLKEYKPWEVINQLKQFFEVRVQGLTPKLTDDIDVLMIVHPFGLSEASRYAIDQYVLRGGKALVFVDPHAEEGGRSNAAMRLPPGVGSDLPDLLKAWGVAYDKDKVLGDLEAGQRVQAGMDSFGRPIITRYVAWTTYGPQNIKTDDVVAADLAALNFATPGFLEKLDDATTTFDPLIWSTNTSGPFGADMVRHNPQPAEILKEFKPQDRRYVVAARLSGKARSAFPDGPPEADDKEQKPEDGDKAAAKPHLDESGEDINVIVFADTDILADGFWVSRQEVFGQVLTVPIANNGDLVLNAADNLAGSSALVSLRGRGLSKRPFEVVERIQNEAESRYRARQRELEQELQEIQQKLQSLQTKEQGEGGQIVSPAQQEEIVKFRARVVEIRQQLREVQLNLRKDIDQLESNLKVINIAGMPVVVALAALVIALVRRRRRLAG